MKIEPTRNPLATDVPAAKTSNAHAARPAASPNAAGSVKISETSRSLSTGTSNNTEAPFDVKRVEAIKSAISAGQFKVNPEAVADKILTSASQLLTGA